MFANFYDVYMPTMSILSYQCDLTERRIGNRSTESALVSPCELTPAHLWNTLISHFLSECSGF